MIALFTDYSLSDPYVGQLHAVLKQQSPDTPVIDLMHDAPRFSPKASAYLLASIIQPFPKGTIFCCVVDPGVGSERLPCIVEADGNYFVGPDNGLFAIVACRAKILKWNTINWRPKTMSKTFHGRDLFAPVAAMLANKTLPEVTQEKNQQKLTEYDWPDDYLALIYIDGFGNVMTGIRGSMVNDTAILKVADVEFCYADHFSAVEAGVGFWYRNSLGLVEFAVNCGRVDVLPGMEIGQVVEVLG